MVCFFVLLLQCEIVSFGEVWQYWCIGIEDEVLVDVVIDFVVDFGDVKIVFVEDGDDVVVVVQLIGQCVGYGFDCVFDQYGIIGGLIFVVFGYCVFDDYDIEDVLCSQLGLGFGGYGCVLFDRDDGFGDV